MRTSPLASTRFTSSSSSVIRAVSRWGMGIVGILWVAIAASFCGCSPASPVNGWVMNESGQAYYEQGEYALARGEFERALMDRPYSPDYAFNVAAAMDQQGDHIAAEKMYRHALTLDPGHRPAYHGMAAMMLEDGRTAEANDLINTWAATQPYSPEAATELGWLKGEQGDLEGADRELRRALRENPRHTRAMTQLGRVHGKSGRRSDAAAEYARSLFMDPTQSDARTELASLNSDAYGTSALQMAATMPLYDPTLQAGAPPNFTAPQAQMASHPGWTSSPAGMQATNAPMSYSMPPGSGAMYSPPTSQANWSQSPMPTPPQFMNGQQTYPAAAYPEAVSYSPMPQPDHTGRPTPSFFQPQQSFPGAMPQPVMSTTQLPLSDKVPANPTPATWNDTPTWGTSQPTPMFVPAPGGSMPPAMNASFGNAIPAEQISSAPVVPAF